MLHITMMHYYMLHRISLAATLESRVVLAGNSTGLTSQAFDHFSNALTINQVRKQERNPPLQTPHSNICPNIKPVPLTYVRRQDINLPPPQPRKNNYLTPPTFSLGQQHID